MTIGIVAVLIMLAAVTPSPYAIEQPGPVVNAFGAMKTASGESVDVIRVEGARTYPTSGALNVLSVSIDGTPDRPVDWISLVGTFLDPTRSAVPLSSLYPEGLSAEERTKQNAAMMRSSQQSATAAALRRLGEPVGEKVRIAGVSSDGPSAGKLQEGEVILSAEGKKVTSLADLRDAVSRVPDGDPIRLGVDRDGKETEVSVVPETASNGTRLLGVTVSEEFTFPFQVKLDLENIRGPSAGLVFALAITDMLTPGELTGGKQISGTGT
ncbi:MAG: PDZ domain-containing protein, partial [Actinobacteria bacterium]|nr:PDZ domain-containing protein [Actinomycetota bacterium]